MSTKTDKLSNCLTLDLVICFSDYFLGDQGFEEMQIPLILVDVALLLFLLFLGARVGCGLTRLLFGLLRLAHQSVHDVPLVSGQVFHALPHHFELLLVLFEFHRSEALVLRHLLVELRPELARQVVLIDTLKRQLVRVAEYEAFDQVFSEPLELLLLIGGVRDLLFGEAIFEDAQVPSDVLDRHVEGLLNLDQPILVGLDHLGGELVFVFDQLVERVPPGRGTAGVELLRQHFQVDVRKGALVHRFRLLAVIVHDGGNVAERVKVLDLPLVDAAVEHPVDGDLLLLNLLFELVEALRLHVLLDGLQAALVLLDFPPDLVQVLLGVGGAELVVVGNTDQLLVVAPLFGQALLHLGLEGLDDGLPSGRRLFHDRVLAHRGRPALILAVLVPTEIVLSH